MRTRGRFPFCPRMRHADMIFMKKNLLKTALALFCTALSCTPETFESLPVVCDGPVTVGFAVSDGVDATRSVAGPDGLSTQWVSGDEIALWADNGSGFALEAVPFSVYGLTGSGAFFTSELESPMADGTYTYYATYPVPDSINGTKAAFTVPTVQDGHSGGGEDIMIAAPASALALVPIDWLAAEKPGLSLALDHKLHRLRFYTSDSRFEGEPIQKIMLDFPRAVAGTVEADISDPSAGLSLTSGSNALTIEPESPVAISAGSVRNYATASIVPTKFDTDESMSVILYTESKIARAVIPLKGRNFAAGHSTPVRIIPSSVGNLCRLYVEVVSNNLGENVQTITFTAPQGCKWSDSGSETFVYNPGTDIDAGHSFILEYEDESAFRTLSGKSVTVTYDSEHVRISETVTMDNLDGKLSARMKLNVPYLLYEDFSVVPSFSSHDEYGTSSAGSKSAYSFLNGWTGGRVGADAGKCIRIACRRETSVDYAARVDSAPLRGTLKKPADISVEFDYGANNRYGGIPIIVDGNVGQDCHIGYITSAKGYESGDEDGTFEKDNTFYVREYTGSWDNTPNNASYTIHNAPATAPLRITWRTTVEHQAGTTNTTAWLYLDNIKIKISKD